MVFIMDESKIIKIKGENKYLAKLIFGGIILIIIFYVVVQFLVLVGHPFDIGAEKDPRSALGALGDYFGGLLNPLFAFLSFIGVLWTLKMSREELLETRKVMDEQLKTQFLQQFESLFFSLLNQMTKNLDQITRVNDYYKFPQHYNKIFNIEDRAEVIMTKMFDIPSKESLTVNVMRRMLIEDKNFSNFFIFLYQILKNIDYKIDESKLVEEEKKNLKKNYFNILRSLIPEKILHLLLLNVYEGGEEYNFDRYKDLVERAEFFEHFNFSVNQAALYPILLCAKRMKGSAFGGNEQFKSYVNHVFVKSLTQNSSGYFLGGLNELLRKSKMHINTNDVDYEELIINFEDDLEHIFIFKKEKNNKNFHELQYRNNETSINGNLNEFKLIEDNKISFLGKGKDDNFNLEISLNKDNGTVISIVII